MGSAVERAVVECSAIECLEERLRPWAESLRSHAVYSKVNDDRSVQRFMEWHVFCVWDFMSLLSALRQRLTGSSVPWRPTRDAAARRLINEIALDEESDETPLGPLSHFELYVRAMSAAGADTGPIDRLCARATTQGWRAALRDAEAPRGVAGFVATTLEIATTGSLAEVAAAFTFGREAVIPAMFEALVSRLAADTPSEWSLMRFYLERHIEVDRGAHGAAARSLVERACAEDPASWERGAAAAEASLRARIALWDAVVARLDV